MASREELQQVAQRSLSNRDARRLEPVVRDVSAQLEHEEQILGVVAGDWFDSKRCLLVATSRRVIAADDARVDSILYTRLLTVDYSESWRKARILLRAQGAVAEIKNIAQDQAREMNSLINTARRLSSTAAQ